MSEKRVSVCAIRGADRKILLCHRRDDHYRRPGEWDLPGGKAEPGETDVEAAVRECREETGLEIEVRFNRGYILSGYPDNSPKKITFFECGLKDESAAPSSPSGDFDGFMWVSSVAEIGQLALPEADKAMLRLLLD